MKKTVNALFGLLFAATPMLFLYTMFFGYPPLSVGIILISACVLMMIGEVLTW